MATGREFHVETGSRSGRTPAGAVAVDGGQAARAATSTCNFCTAGPGMGGDGWHSAVPGDLAVAISL
jgi:hypothetical protein